MADLVKHAKRLDSRIKELNTELKKTQDKLSEVTRDKQDRLLKSALSPQGNATGSIDRINQEIAFLKQKIEDVGFVKGKLVEELLSVAEKIKQQRLSEKQSKIASLTAEKAQINGRIRKLHAEIQKLKAKISTRQVFLDGRPIGISREENIAYQIMEGEGEIGQIKPLTEKDILRELGIELEEEKQESAPSLFPWRCGQCGLEKSFATENEQANFATRHFEGECELEKTAQKRAKREEVLS